ncbi:MAG: tripartite tricarboxylate transporter TctB family protein [Burkholderiaceae bacterium]
MRTPIRWRKDHAGGALLVAAGIAVVAASLGYGVGSLRQMGSGYFPLALGVVMALMGAVLLATTPWRDAPQPPPDDALPGGEHAHLAGPVWQPRGWLCIVGALGAFVVLGDHGGLVPASFASVFIAALGDRRNGPRDAALLAAGMTAFGVIVFHYGLHLLLPLFQWA